MVNTNSNNILFSNLQIRREVIVKTGVTIRMLANVFAVDPDLAVAIDSIELDRYGFTLIILGDIK